MSDRRQSWLRLGGGLVALVLAIWGGSIAAVVLYGRRDEARPAAAIVVLGAAQYEGRPSPVLRARLEHALALWRQGLAPLLIVTGGRGRNNDTTSEAAVSRRFALAHGVPARAILYEGVGKSTSESLRTVAALLRDSVNRRVVLVSDPFHMLRLVILSQRLGLTPLPSPTRTSPISATLGKQWRYVLGESVKVPLTFLFDWEELASRNW